MFTINYKTFTAHYVKYSSYLKKMFNVYYQKFIIVKKITVCKEKLIELENMFCVCKKGCSMYIKKCPSYTKAHFQKCSKYVKNPGEKPTQ